MPTSPDDPSSPQDPVCPACSKPIQSKAFAVLEHGDLIHMACRARLAQRRALDLVDRMGRHLDRAGALVAEARGLRRRAPWLIIVAWDHRHIASELTRRFEGRAEVLVDRRDRPGVKRPALWLGPERRQPLTLPEAAMWRDFGFRMLYRGE